MKTSTNILPALLLIVVMISIHSCSIKEDRSFCPCILNLDYSYVRNDERFPSVPGWDSLLVSIPGTYGSFVRIGDYPLYHSVYVPRKKTDLSCYLGLREERFSVDRLRYLIPLGEDSDRVFSFHKTLPLAPDSEEVLVSPIMCGQTTRIVVEMEPGSGLETGYLLVATGSTCGFDLTTGEPLEGEFCRIMSPYGENSRYFNMPRQIRRDVSIAVVGGESEDLLFSIDLAGELDAAGYDWDAKSLPPLVIIRILSQELHTDVRIIDWDEAVYLNFTL